MRFPAVQSDLFDERVDSAYSVGYDPDERRALVDAYMQDFAAVFGYYPKTIGSWVLDPVTIAYAQEKYGVIGAAICRDQLGTDGFTLGEGFRTGSTTPAGPTNICPHKRGKDSFRSPLFRLLAPDPVFSFEQDARPGLSGVYTLEPCCTNGRDPERIRWYFACLTDTDRCGVGVRSAWARKNNFLWENIRPGFEPQLRQLLALSREGKLRIETMAESAAWFSRKYARTPPLSWPVVTDWQGGSAGQKGDAQPGALWYAGAYYRIGFLAEAGRLRIRDWFLYDERFPRVILKKDCCASAGKQPQRGGTAAGGQCM